MIVTHPGQICPPRTGATRRIWGLASHLRSNGFQVTILATSERMTQITIQGVRIIEMPPALPTTSGIRSKLATSLAAKASAVKFVTFYSTPTMLCCLPKWQLHMISTSSNWMRGQEVVRRNYTWGRIAQKSKQTYMSLVRRS